MTEEQATYDTKHTCDVSGCDDPAILCHGYRAAKHYYCTAHAQLKGFCCGCGKRNTDLNDVGLCPVCARDERVVVLERALDDAQARILELERRRFEALDARNRAMIVVSQKDRWIESLERDLDDANERIKDLRGSCELVVRQFADIGDGEWPTTGMHIAVERCAAVLKMESEEKKRGFA